MKDFSIPKKDVKKGKKNMSLKEKVDLISEPDGQEKENNIIT